MSSPSVSAEPPYAGAPPDVEQGHGRAYLVTAMFLAPAVILLGVWILYPLVYTVWRSFYDRSGANFIWLDNYRTLFTTDTTRTAIKNNAIWVAVVPALVTAIGLIFAVLTERIRWSVAFKIAVFMPMAVSLFAAGVIWRIMYQQEPSRGALNAVTASVVDRVKPPGPLSDAFPSGNQADGDTADRDRAQDACPAGIRGTAATDRDSARPGARRFRPGQAAGAEGGRGHGRRLA